MADTPRPSNWTKATGDADLRCPACGAANRPGVPYVEINEKGQAYCTVCSHVWLPKH
jgi:uncharacterized Zn-finger protein